MSTHLCAVYRTMSVLSHHSPTASVRERCEWKFMSQLAPVVLESIVYRPLCYGFVLGRTRRARRNIVQFFPLSSDVYYVHIVI
jgi:hypothetical protein